jgi:hypothetical protein
MILKNISLGHTIGEYRGKGKQKFLVAILYLSVQKSEKCFQQIVKNRNLLLIISNINLNILYFIAYFCVCIAVKSSIERRSRTHVSRTIGV